MNLINLINYLKYLAHLMKTKMVLKITRNLQKILMENIKLSVELELQYIRFWSGIFF